MPVWSSCGLGGTLGTRVTFTTCPLTIYDLLDADIISECEHHPNASWSPVMIQSGIFTFPLDPYLVESYEDRVRRL